MPRPKEAVPVTDIPPSADDEIAEIGATPRSSRLREVAAVTVVVLVLAAVALTVARNRHAFFETLHKVGPGGMLLSLVFGLIGIGATYLQWRSVMAGLGVRFGLGEGAGVFFVSQLGKYLPGSVWPILVQMEAGHRRGANRKTVLAGNLISLVLNIAAGVVLAGVLLPFSFPAALHRFWWALAALPALLILAHPRSLPFLLDGLLRVLRRAPLGVQMTSEATFRAAGWSTVAWLGQGLHLVVLCAALGRPTFGLVALCVGGMGLAVSAGVLFLPAPAGAGLREVVLGYVLVSIMTSGQAVAVVVASRVILILVDLLLGGLGAVLVKRTMAAPVVSA
jgi:hypothetical protein